MRKARWLLSIVVSLLLAASAVPQSRNRGRGPSVNPGGITIRDKIHGTGSSSGDSLKLTVAPRGKGSAREVVVKVPPGTRLGSSSKGAQGMVVAGVRGRSLGGDKFAPASEIRASTTEPRTYILEAYCADFHKANPSPSVTFKVVGEDPVLACVLREGHGLSVAAKQAAVWIHTDQVTFREMRAKFPVTQSEWEAAQRVAKLCPDKASVSRARKPPATRAGKKSGPQRLAKSGKPPATRGGKHGRPAARHR